MIRNLNPISFQEFGTVVHERPHTSHPAGIDTPEPIPLDQETAFLYRTTSRTLLRCHSGNIVMAVSLDGENYKHFYLDRPVYVNSDILLYCTPLVGAASVTVEAPSEPLPAGSHSVCNFRVDRKTRVGGIYTFFYQEREQGFLFPGEAHPMPELTYVDQGQLHSVADGHDILMEQGDITVYGPGQWHMQYADMGVAPRFVTITFDLDGLDVTPLINRKFRAPQSVIQLLTNMLKEQERMDAYSNDMIMAQLGILLLLLLREEDSPSTAKLQASNSLHNENEIIRRAQQFISGNIRTKLSVPTVARHVDVSPSYLTALFHKNLQISPGEYIRRAKLQESKQMIRENNLNFTQIAAALQYSTVHHFSRQFKEKFGITPTEYAKSVR